MLIIYKQFNFCHFKASAYTNVDRLYAVFYMIILSAFAISSLLISSQGPSTFHRLCHCQCQCQCQPWISIAHRRVRL